jgi:transcriptional regulator with XRE-family HTH domain
MTPNRLKRCRLKLGHTQEQFAKMLGYNSGRYIRALESGERVITDRTKNHIELLMKDLK